MVTAIALVSAQPAPKVEWRQRIERIRSLFPGDIAVYAKHLRTGETLAIDADTVYETFSVIKVPIMAEVLRGLGATVETAGDRCILRFDDEPDWHAPSDAVSRIRGSISVLGPLVGRARRAQLVMPGGDRIGARRIDLHLRGLEAMGATVTEHGNEVLTVSAGAPPPAAF